MKAHFRYHMNKNGLLIEHYYRETLESIRKADSRFKGCRIRHVLQMIPQDVPVGVVINVNTGAPA